MERGQGRPAWHHITCPFEFWRFFPTNLHYYILSFIMFLCTNRTCSSVGEEVVEQASGPGFESQVPPLFHIVFLSVIRRVYRWDDHHGPSSSNQPDVQEARSDGYHMKVHQRPWSTCSRGSKKSTWTNSFWAQNCQQHTPPNYFLRPNFSLSFLFIFFFYLIILIIF